MNKKASEQDKKALVELVKEEVDLHRQGKIERLSNNKELGNLMGVYKTSITKYLSQIGLIEATDREYRRKSISKDGLKNKWQDKDFATKEKRAISTRTKKMHKDGKFNNAAKSRIKYNDNIINSICLDYVFFDDPNSEIINKYGLPKKSNSGSSQISSSLSKCVQKGFISKTEVLEARKRRRSNLIKESWNNEESRKRRISGVSKALKEKWKNNNKFRLESIKNMEKGRKRYMNENPDFNKHRIKYSEDIINKVCLDYVFFNDPLETIRENYGITHSGQIKRLLFKGVKKEFILGEQRKDAGERRTTTALKKMWEKKAHKEKMKEVAKRSAESLRKSTYNVQGRFSPASMQEGAVALMLEKYIHGYNVKESETFQVGDKGIDNGGIDFYVNGDFLEWHPIILNTRLGDIPKNLSKSYGVVNNILAGKRKTKFQEKAEEILAKRYQRKRQEFIDNSGYAGANLVHARDVKELYNFISKHNNNNNNLPSYDKFRREFNYNVKEMKQYKVNKKDLEKKVVGVA